MTGVPTSSALCTTPRGLGRCCHTPPTSPSSTQLALAGPEESPGRGSLWGALGWGPGLSIFSKFCGHPFCAARVEGNLWKLLVEK